MTTRIRILARKITSHSIADRQGSKNGFFRDHSSSFFCGGGGGGVVMDLSQHRDILTLTSQLVDMANLLYGGIRESCVLIGYPSRQDGTILPARDFPFRFRKKNIPFFAV